MRSGHDAGGNGSILLSCIGAAKSGSREVHVSGRGVRRVLHELRNKESSGGELHDVHHLAFENPKKRGYLTSCQGFAMAEVAECFTVPLM